MLAAAEHAHVRRVVLASSVNAIGGVHSREPRWDFFPVDEALPGYAEDPYSLSKWECEQQAGAFARRVPGLSVVCLRLHALLPDVTRQPSTDDPEPDRKDLWGWTPMSLAVRACLAAAARDRPGCEVVYVVAPETTSSVPSAQLARALHPDVPLRRPLPGHRSFFADERLRALLGEAAAPA